MLIKLIWNFLLCFQEQLLRVRWNPLIQNSEKSFNIIIYVINTSFIMINFLSWSLFKLLTNGFGNFVKRTVMQIEKSIINDRLRVSKMSWKFRIPTIYNFAVIYPWNLIFFYKAAYFFISFYCLFCLQTKLYSSIT